MKDAEVRFEKSPCTKCGVMTYKVCYIGSRCGNLVCVDCFSEACDAAEKKLEEKREGE